MAVGANPLTDARTSSAAISWLRDAVKPMDGLLACHAVTCRLVEPLDTDGKVEVLFLAGKELAPDPIGAADQSERR